MSTTRNRMLLSAPLFFSLACLAVLTAGCGGGVRNELAMVPGTCLFHVHMERGMSPLLLDEIMSLDRNLVVAESLLTLGPVGVTLMGVDITSLSPQFLFLSREISPQNAASMVSGMLDLTGAEGEDKTDLSDDSGLVRASVSARNGWTAIYIGPAANVTMDAWLRMDEMGSLAADEALLQALPASHHATLMLPGNLFTFVSLLPVERYVPWWDDYTAVARVVRPSALTLSLSWPSTGPILLEARVSREDGAMTSMELTLTDTAVTPDSAFVLLSGLAGSLL
ncbi:MAG: hypothetical protein R6V62_05400 [Candidatus Fermentibacteraceae bacterium]